MSAPTVSLAELDSFGDVVVLARLARLHAAEQARLDRALFEARIRLQRRPGCPIARARLRQLLPRYRDLLGRVAAARARLESLRPSSDRTPA